MQIQGRLQIALGPDLHVLWWWPICPIQFGLGGDWRFEGYWRQWMNLWWFEIWADVLITEIVIYYYWVDLVISYCWEVFKDFTVDLYRVNSQVCSHGCHMRGCLEGQGFVQKALHHTHAYYWWIIVQKLHLCTGCHPHCPLCYVISSIE